MGWMDIFASTAHAINRNRSVTPSEVVVVSGEKSVIYISMKQLSGLFFYECIALPPKH